MRRVGPPWSIPCLIYASMHIGISVAAYLYWPTYDPRWTAFIFVTGLILAGLGAWAVKRETGVWWP